MDKIRRLLDKFNMKVHPEGGYFGDGFRSTEFLRSDQLPKRYSGPRNVYSSIYFMVTKDRPSRFHRLKTDEIWHFYSGDTLTLHLIHDHGKYECIELGNREEHERFQFLAPKNTWLAAGCNGKEGYSLMGCSLAPGFEYDDFELADKEQLLKEYPQIEAIISEFT